MTGFVYRPRPVVGTAIKAKIAASRAKVRKERQSRFRHVYRKGNGWVARVWVNQTLYEGPICATEEQAHEALRALRAEAVRADTLDPSRSPARS